MLQQITDSFSYNQKHINMNKSIHDKIAHQQLKLPLLIVENIIEYTREHPGKNIGSES